jgi:uncharacterized membrane protein YkoI
MIFRIPRHAVLLAALLALPTGALAQAPAPVRPDRPAISMDEARRIANDNGMVRIEEIELDDGRWEIEGRDAAGAEIEIDLSAADGTVLKMERDRPATAGARP